MIYALISLAGLLPASFGFGIFAGAKLRGFIPLRSPNNKTRLANAQTDTEIAELAVERRKHEMQLSYVELEGTKRLNALEQETKLLTTSAESEATTNKLMGFIRGYFPGAFSNTSIGVKSDEELLDTLGEQISKMTHVVNRANQLLAASIRLKQTNRQLPYYFIDALTGYSDVSPRNNEIKGVRYGE